MKLYYVDHGNFPTSFNTNNCPLDSTSTIDTRYCIKFSSDTTYQYIPNNSINPPDFSIAATKGTTSYKVTNDSTPSQGDNTNFGLVLSLDAGNSASYSGSGTTWTDLSGSNNNGTLVNGVTYSSANGGVLGFDGVNDYVNSGINDSLKIRDRIAISAWVSLSRTLAAGELGGIVDNTPTSGAFNYILTVINSNRVSCSFQNTSYTQLASSESIGLNAWHYVAMTVDDSNINLYIDGINKTSAPKTTSTFSWNSTYIGNWRSNGYYFPGSIGEVRIYNRSLNATEILQNFDTTKGRYGL